MTNEQWSDVTRYLKLPDAARKPLEEQLDGYRSRDILLPRFPSFAGAGAEPDPRPSDVKKKLERAASLAGELLNILGGVKSVGSVGYNALIGAALSEASFHITKREARGNSMRKTQLECPDGQSPAISAVIAMVDHHAHLTALYNLLSIAAETFAIKGKSGSDPSDVRELLKRVSKIVETHTGRPLSKGKAENDFARKFCKLADPQIGPGAIKLALENLRARIAAKNSSNPG